MLTKVADSASRRTDFVARRTFQASYRGGSSAPTTTTMSLGHSPRLKEPVGPHCRRRRRPETQSSHLGYPGVLTQRASAPAFVARRTLGDGYRAHSSTPTTTTMSLGHSPRLREPRRLHCSRRRRLETLPLQVGYPAMMTQRASVPAFVARRTSQASYRAHHSTPSTITKSLGHPYRHIEPVGPHCSRRRRLEVEFSQVGYPVMLTQHANFCCTSHSRGRLQWRLQHSNHYNYVSRALS
jgi:hypothetical protein